MFKKINIIFDQTIGIENKLNFHFSFRVSNNGKIKRATKIMASEFNNQRCIFDVTTYVQM